MDEGSSEFKQVGDLIMFKELVASLRINYEKGFWSILHKLVRSLSHFLDKFETGQNQSTWNMNMVVWKVGFFDQGSIGLWAWAIPL